MAACLKPCLNLLPRLVLDFLKSNLHIIECLLIFDLFILVLLKFLCSLDVRYTVLHRDDIVSFHGLECIEGLIFLLVLKHHHINIIIFVFGTLAIHHRRVTQFIRRCSTVRQPIIPRSDYTLTLSLLRNMRQIFGSLV